VFVRAAVGPAGSSKKGRASARSGLGESMLAGRHHLGRLRLEREVLKSHSLCEEQEFCEVLAEQSGCLGAEI